MSGIERFGGIGRNWEGLRGIGRDWAGLGGIVNIRIMRDLEGLCGALRGLGGIERDLEGLGWIWIGRD